LCEAAAERTGGVVFPAVFWGAFDTMPFPFTFHFRKEGIRSLVREMLPQLEKWGFMVIVLLTGHYPPSQVKLLRKECRRFNKKGKALALGAPEQVFATDIKYYGDHAGMWETSMMMAIRPELVDLSAMPKGLSTMERLDKYGVMGRDPAEKAGAELGRKAIDHITENLADAVKRALEDGDDRAFEEAYFRYDKALSIFSTNIFRLAREALDVRSLGELIRYGVWIRRNL
jgi:creatinine amidohydrolase